MGILPVKVTVRGVVGNNKIIVLVNGMRVNPPGGDPLGIRSDFSVREAEQIEVIYGPGSTLYGQDAISAVINVKTKRTGGHSPVRCRRFVETKISQPDIAGRKQDAAVLRRARWALTKPDRREP